MITLKKPYLLAGAIVLLITVLFAIGYFNSFSAKASSPPGAPTTIATSTSPTLTVGVSTVIIATSTCSARVISTGSTSVMLTFSDYNNAAPSLTSGILQLSSSTVVYDSGQYGCGLVKAFANTGTVITVIDSR